MLQERLNNVEARQIPSTIFSTDLVRPRPVSSVLLTRSVRHETQRENEINPGFFVFICLSLNMYGRDNRNRYYNMAIKGGMALYRNRDAIYRAGKSLFRTYKNVQASGSKRRNSVNNGNGKRKALPQNLPIAKRTRLARAADNRLRRGRYVPYKNANLRASKGTNLTGLVGRVKRRAYKKIGPSFSARTGAVQVLERRGSWAASSAGAVYLGHGIACDVMHNNVIRCILKELFKQCGHAITDYGNAVPSPTRYKIYFEYVINPATVPPVLNVISYQVAALNTYNTVVGQLAALLRANIADSGVPIEPTKWYMTDPTLPAGVTEEIQLAVIWAKNFIIDMQYTSHLKIQNRTLASANDDDADQADDITNNPLVGRVYGQQKHWSNAVTPFHRTGVVANTFVLDRAFGFIAFQSTNDEPRLTQKPPPPWVFGYKKAANLKVDPGSIYEDSHVWSAKMSMVNYFVRFYHYIATTTPDAVSTLGKVNLIGLEKELDSVGSLGTPITVGYQLDQVYRLGTVYKHNMPTVAVLDVATGQLTTS